MNQTLTELTLDLTFFNTQKCIIHYSAKLEKTVFVIVLVVIIWSQTSDAASLFIVGMLNLKVMR